MNHRCFSGFKANLSSLGTYLLFFCRLILPEISLCILTVSCSLNVGCVMTEGSVVAKKLLEVLRSLPFKLQGSYGAYGLKSLIDFTSSFFLLLYPFFFSTDCFTFHGKDKKTNVYKKIGEGGNNNGSEVHRGVSDLRQHTTHLYYGSSHCH